MRENIYSHCPTPEQRVADIRSSICEYITGHRLSHTLSVEKEALAIAGLVFPVIGIGEEYLSDVKSAALLHDITKHYTLDEHLEICNKYGVDLSDKAILSPALLHSKTGAFTARERFGINDIVFNAIYHHTSGNEDMDIISKIIFLADYIEPTRLHESCKAVREEFYKGIQNGTSPLFMLDRCIVRSIDLTLAYLLKQNSLIHIQTVKTRNYLLAESHCTKRIQKEYDNEKEQQ